MHIRHRFIVSLFLLLLVADVGVFVGNACAQSDSAIKIQYTHVAPTNDTLPAPGFPLTLTVQMNREVIAVGMHVRAIISRDGVLTEVQDQEPRLDAMEKVYFDVEIPSPLVEMSYQFIFVDKSGNSVGTRRYSVTRTCAPSVIGNVVVPHGKGSVSKDDAKALKATADALDDEIKLYEKISGSLSSIQETIDKK